MFDKVKEVVKKKNHNEMVDWLRRNNVEQLSESVDWYKGTSITIRLRNSAR